MQTSPQIFSALLSLNNPHLLIIYIHGQNSLKICSLYILPFFSHNTVASEQTEKRVLSSVKCYTLDFSMQTMVIIRVVLFLMYLFSHCITSASPPGELNQ